MNKPELNYQIDKCLNMVEVQHRLEEKYNIKFSGYRGIDFYDFIAEKLMDNVVFPKTQMKHVIGDKDIRYNNFVGFQSVVEIPMHYDSSNDDVDYEKKKKDFFKNMIGYFNHKNDKTDSEIKEHVENLEKYVNFGTKNFEKVNDILKAIHEEYSQYYVDGKVRVWYPIDWEPWEGKEEFDYPEYCKSYKLSELIEYFDDKYGFDATDLHSWLLDVNFIEGRHWETTWALDYDDEDKLARKTFRGIELPESLEHVINILEKDFVDENEDEFLIFIDFYK